MIIHVCPVCSSQIAYLENLLKVYNEEICRLQQAELSLTDMEAEDSLYIQEHKLKRKVSLQCANTDIKAVKSKCLRQPEWQLLTPPSRVLLLFFQMMKIYEKLCELKGCSTLTGRAIEQRISYKSTRYPEINRRVSCTLLGLLSNLRGGLRRNRARLFLHQLPRWNQIQLWWLWF